MDAKLAIYSDLECVETVIMKKSLKTNDQQCHLDQQNEQSPPAEITANGKDHDIWSWKSRWRRN
jgi:hypothetical protein